MEGTDKIAKMTAAWKVIEVGMPRAEKTWGKTASSSLALSPLLCSQVGGGGGKKEVAMNKKSVRLSVGERGDH